MRHLVDSPVDVSVIVPVYNDTERLTLCLEALAQQDFQGIYEVLVVDNGSDEIKGVEELVSSYDFALLLQESEKGSYAARNAGLKVARGNIIAFTDSDCIPCIRWLLEGVTSIDNGADMVGGEVKIFFKDPDRPTSVELYESIFAFRQSENVLKGFAVTANLFVKRELFEDLGAFYTSTLSGGDVHFTKRATAKGCSLIYQNTAFVFHPARRNLYEYRKKIRRVAGGGYVLKDSFGKEYSVLGIGRAFIPPFSLIKRAIRFGRGRMSWGQIGRVILVSFHNKYYAASYKLVLRLGLVSELER